MKVGSSGGNTTPRFSVVTAAYNVGRYLPEFIESIERQSFDLSRLQIIVVDDGSTDDTPQRLAQWQSHTGSLVTVLTQPNQGQASARNLGLDHARGEWVTFVDADDLLDRNYFKRVDHFLAGNPATEMVATLRLLYWDDSGEMVPQALWRFFADGDRLVNLDDNPQYFHVSAPAAFFKLERVREQALAFDPRVGPHFEDGHFCVRYLLQSPRAEVAFVQSAKYLYRRRADSSSTTQTSMSLTSRFLNVPEHGYLDVLRNARDRTGRIPLWLQHQIVYELRWYLKAASEPGESAMAARGETAERFLGLVTEILTFIDPAVISAFDVQPLTPEWRDILLHSFQGSPWHGDYAVTTASDEYRNLVRVEYRFVGPAPDETFLVAGSPVEPEFAKYRSIRMFDHTLIRERIAWLPSEPSLGLELDGEVVPLLRRWPAPPASLPARTEPQVTAWKLASHGSGTRLLPLLARATGWYRSLRGDLHQRAAGSRSARALYTAAWVLDDGPLGVMRSSEALFEYLREHRSNINCWFVADRGSSAWSRLNAGDQDSHVVARGSKQWQLLMLNCAVLVSSDPDPAAHRPLEIAKFRDPQWVSVFLPATVIQRDLSRSLNPKEAALVLTSTPDEYSSIVSDDSGYRYTSRETSLTGLPRFDRLRDYERSVPPQRRDLVLVNPCPTGALPGSASGRGQSGAASADLAVTTDRRAWLELLRDPDLRRCLDDRNLDLVLLPDPPNWPENDSEIPGHVRRLTLSDSDPAELIARAAVFVTDYSPLAFDAAYLNRPVVYAQMDSPLAATAAEMQGRLNLEEHGFGPVTRSPDDAVVAIESALVSATSSGRYAKRVEQAFPYRGGSTSERVTRAIEGLTAPAARARR